MSSTKEREDLSDLIYFSDRFRLITQTSSGSITRKSQGTNFIPNDSDKITPVRVNRRIYPNHPSHVSSVKTANYNVKDYQEIFN